MPHRLPRPIAVLALTLAACLGASMAQAQTAPTGQRYMTWANRPANTTPGDVVAAQQRARNGMIPRRVAPSQALSPPVMQAPVQMMASNPRGLTPASAWLGPRVAPAYAPGSPDPTGYTADLRPVSAPAPAPAYSTPAPRAAAPAPTYTPVPASVAAQPMAAQPAPESAPANDPNAPRRDAPIFRLQQQGAAPTADAGQPAPQTYAQAAPALGQSTAQPGARYYSVHRDAGHAPDPTTIPEPVFFDSVTLDLAQPPEQELPTRDAQGRRRPVPNENPSLP